MSAATLQVRFETPEALREEFAKNIANRGVFVVTDEFFENRQRVQIEILLTYVSAVEVAHSLAGEVVHCIPKEMAASGATPGVAIQFDATASELVADFEPLLGALPAEALDADTENQARRGAKRRAVRVPVRIMPTMSPPFEATSRDLSASGILLSIAEHPLPVGEVVRVCLWHPTGEPSVEIDGRVVREVKNKSGEIAAAAVAFNEYQVREPAIREVVDALRHAGHHNQLGGISGSLSDLGLANMLQMFGSSAPQGTLVVEYEGEQGWIAFQKERFLAAQMGAYEGREALIEMLHWGDGQFQFEATVDETLSLADDAPMLTGLILDAVCVVDELNRETDEEEMTGADVSEDLMVDLNAELAKEIVPGALTGTGTGTGTAIEEGSAEDPFGMDASEEQEIELDFDFSEEELAEAEAEDDIEGAAETEEDAEQTQAMVSEENAAAVDRGLDIETELDIVDETTFMVDFEQEEAWGPELDKTDGAVIDLAKAGMSLAQMESIIPEPSETVHASVVNLIEMGVLFPRP